MWMTTRMSAEIGTSASLGFGEKDRSSGDGTGSNDGESCAEKGPCHSYPPETTGMNWTTWQARKICFPRNN